MGYALFASTNYFTQISYVARGIEADAIEGLEVFLLDNPDSFIFAQDNLAYTFLFVALAFFAPVFRRGLLDRWIRRLFVTTSAVGLLGTLGYLVGEELLAVGLLASAVPYLGAIILLVVRFSRKGPEEPVT
jgi:hypothetical protein